MLVFSHISLFLFFSSDFVLILIFMIFYDFLFFFLGNFYFSCFLLIFWAIIQLFVINVFLRCFSLLKIFIDIIFASHLPIYGFWTWWVYVTARHLNFLIWVDRVSSLDISTMYW